ncbi:cytidine/deoxycytidylate deaminase family protein [Apiospora arundinis]
MPSSSQADGDRSSTRASPRITTHPTTSAERKAERERLSEARQKLFVSKSDSSSNRNVMLADQTRNESIAIKKAEKKMQKKLDHILDKLN